MVKDLDMISKSGCSTSPLPLHAEPDIIDGAQQFYSCGQRNNTGPPESWHWCQNVIHDGDNLLLKIRIVEYGTDKHLFLRIWILILWLRTPLSLFFSFLKLLKLTQGSLKNLILPTYFFTFWNCLSTPRVLNMGRKHVKTEQTVIIWASRTTQQNKVKIVTSVSESRN